MGLKLAVIAGKRHPRTFEFEGEQVNIEVYGHKITPEYRAQLSQLARKAEAGEEEESPEQKEQDAKMVSDLMPSWDVELTEGEPFPPTYQNLLAVPCTLLGRVATEIMEVVKELSNPSATKSKK